MPEGPVSEYPTPVINPASAPVDLAAMFPTIIPAVEKSVWQLVNDACNSRTIFPSDGSGLIPPVAFNIPPAVSLYADRDGSYRIPVGQNAGQPVPPIPVVRGWPDFPAAVPAIGVAEVTSNDDPGEDTIQGGFAGDVFATDSAGNVLGSCAYYAEPLSIVVVVELIHVNRDERDRLHDQLRRVLWPLKHQFPVLSQQIRGISLDAEKQDLPQDELPRPLYVSVFTLTATCEALIPTEITAVGVIDEINVSVAALPVTHQLSCP